jgi:sulfoxide reductase heme-binding subunit YedZ
VRAINSILASKWTKIPVFALCLVPVAMLLWRYYQNDLTANPIEFITHTTGDWTIRFLVITLAITPVRKLLKLPALIKYRRMMGLFAFFYVCLHFTTYIYLDKYFDMHEIWLDVLKRRFITVGFAAFVLLIPLAITSTAGWIRRIGGKRWQWLHRVTYICAILGVIHYYWLVKSDVRKPLMYAAMVAVLLAYRLIVWLRARGQRPAGQRAVREEPMVTAETA